MSLLGKVEASVETDGPAAKMHDIMCGSRLPQVPAMAPNKVLGIELHRGEWGKVGSITCWKYKFINGASTAGKLLVESVDGMKLSTTFKVIEGDVLQVYKSFKFIIQVTPKAQGSVVHWTLEYEKPNENTPAPTELLQYVVDYTKHVNASLTQSQT